MKRTVVISVNNNPEYLFYLPLVVWAWAKFGWNVLIFKAKELNEPDSVCFSLAKETLLSLPACANIYRFQYVHPHSKFDSVMLAQVSRLYAACVEFGYLMTSDVDMLPLTDYWNEYQDDKITTWGRDLTDFHYPICYIGMMSWQWQRVMDIYSSQYSDMIFRDLMNAKNSMAADPEKRWCVDQDIITDRINKHTDILVQIDRGLLPNGYPLGRVDRSAWTLYENAIDCHMHRGIWKDTLKFNQTLEMLLKYFPDRDVTWFVDYVSKFKSISQ